MNDWDHAVKSLKDHWRIMLAGLFVGLICAVLVMLFQKPVWEAQLTVAPTTRTGMPGLSSILPQSAADTPVLQYFVERIDAATSTDFSRFETLINSPRMAGHLLRMKDVVLPQNTKPDLAKWLDKNVRIRGIGATPFRKITLRYDDPEQAMALLNRLYRETDMVLRHDVQNKTQRRITYLKDQIQKTFHPDHKDALIALLKEQEQTAMMVSIDKQFAAEAIDPPSVKSRPIAPDWRLLFPAFMIGGLLIGLMVGGFVQALYRS